jgi:hypothetical protein
VWEQRSGLWEGAGEEGQGQIEEHVKKKGGGSTGGSGERGGKAGGHFAMPFSLFNVDRSVS